MATLQKLSGQLSHNTFLVQQSLFKNLVAKGVVGITDEDTLTVLAEKVLEVPTSTGSGKLEQEITEAKYFSVQQFLEKQISDSFAITKDWTDYSTAKGSLATYFPELEGGYGFSDMFRNCANLRVSPKIQYRALDPLAPNFSNCFSGCKNLIEFNFTDSSLIKGNLTSMFTGCSSLLNVDFKGKTDIVRASGLFDKCSMLGSVVGLNTGSNMEFGNMFGSCIVLETISTLNFTSAVNEISIFNQYVRSNNCTTIIIEGTINVRNLWWSNSLSIETLRSIIAALTDRVGQTALVITLTTSCAARLTVDDTLAITNKNWTLATIV